MLGVVLAGLVIAKAAGVEVPELGNVKWAHILLGGGVLVFLFILIKLIVGPSTGGVDIGGIGVSKERKIGIFLGLLASIGLVAGRLPQRQGDGRPAGSAGGGAGRSRSAPARAADCLIASEPASSDRPRSVRGRSDSVRGGRP